jgi:hypothetical protein
MQQHAQSLVKQLMEMGFSAQDISEGVGGHVSLRTIYRWAAGTTVPQNKATYEKLISFAKRKGVVQAA